MVIFSDNFFQFDHVGMIKFLQRLNFSQVHAFIPGVELSLHPLDGHQLPRLVALAHQHTPISAISQLPHGGVSVHLGKVVPPRGRFK